MLIDNSPLSYFNKIVDWQLGDDREFVRVLPANEIPTGDSLTDAYLTVKAQPSVPDAIAIIQKHITSVLSPAGQLTGTGNLNLRVEVFSADYEGTVNAGTVYYYDIRVLTSLGHTFTIETGEIEFAQNVTQTNIGGTPAVFPNSGQPRFRGFAPYRPDLNPLNTGLYNVGDFFMNSNPSNGNGAGWQCVVQGAPGTWVPFGQNGSLGSFLGAAAGKPVSGTYVVGNWFQLTPAVPGGPFGIVCTVAGSPGTWNDFGDISLL